MEIKTLRNYLDSGSEEKIYFKSSVQLNREGASLYRTAIPPLDKNGLCIIPCTNKLREFKLVHVPKNQHLEDRVHKPVEASKTC